MAGFPEEQKFRAQGGLPALLGWNTKLYRVRLNEIVRESLRWQHQPGGLGACMGEGESN